MKSNSRLGWNRRLAPHAQRLSFVVFYAMFANIPFWMASRSLGMLPLGWLCLEYVGLGLLALVVPRIVAEVFLLLVVGADLTSGVSKTYYLSPMECLANLRSLLDLPGARQFSVVVILVLTLSVVAIAAWIPMTMIRGRYRSYAAASLVFFAAIAICIDGLTVVRETRHFPNPFRMARPSDVNKFSGLKNLWISRYPIIRLVRNEMLFGGIRDTAGTARADILTAPSASTVALQFVRPGLADRRQEKPNLVLILVESWGLETDLLVRGSLVQPYFQPDLLGRYKVIEGTVPFYGSTVAGEARELCSSMIGSHIMNSSAHQLLGCLPDCLSTLGYYDVAVHGMSGNMFNRLTWYGRVGFQETWFKDRFQQQGLPDCEGAFDGTCDAAIAEWIGRRLEIKSAKPSFLYWVTLNSHLPVPVPATLPAGASCSLTPLLSRQPAFCSCTSSYSMFIVPFPDSP